MSKKLAAVSAAFLFCALSLIAAPNSVLAGADADWPVTFGTLQQSPMFSMKFSNSSASGVLYLSPASDTPTKPYDIVLFDASADDANLIFEFSKRAQDGTWSAWSGAELHIHQDGRLWGRAMLPFGVGPLRFRVINGGIQGGTSLTISGVEVLDSSELSAVQSQIIPSAEVVSPKEALPSFVHTRGEWGAHATVNPYQPMTAPWRITIHHTAGPRTMNLDASLREVLFIQEFQQNGRGWDDIAYHFLIDGAGNVIEGRPLNAVGAHTHGFNDGNIGISMMGYFNKPENEHLTQAQEGALVLLIRYLRSRYTVSLANIKGHRDYEGTKCPGDNVYALLPQIRKDVAVLASTPAPAPAPTPAPVPAPTLDNKSSLIGLQPGHGRDPAVVPWDSRTP